MNVGSDTDYSEVPQSFIQSLDENVRNSLKPKKNTSFLIVSSSLVIKSSHQLAL